MSLSLASSASSGCWLFMLEFSFSFFFTNVVTRANRHLQINESISKQDCKAISHPQTHWSSALLDLDTLVTLLHNKSEKKMCAL